MQLARGGAQVVVELLGRPGCWRGICRRQWRRNPVVDHRAAVSVAGFLRSQQVARRMASAAVAKPQREIGAAIPLRALLSIGFESARFEKQQLPPRLQVADIERKRDAVRPRRCVNGGSCHEVGVERLNVVVGELSEMVIGEHRKKMPAVARDAFMHGAPEGRFGPCADAGLRIGRDIGRIDHAKRSCHRVAAGEPLSTLCCVTGRAIAAARECFALGDELRREAARSRQRDRSDGRPPREQAKAREPETAERDDGDDQLLEHGVLRWRAMARVTIDYPKRGRSREPRTPPTAETEFEDLEWRGLLCAGRARYADGFAALNLGLPRSVRFWDEYRGSPALASGWVSLA